MLDEWIFIHRGRSAAHLRFHGVLELRGPQGSLAYHHRISKAHAAICVIHARTMYVMLHVHARAIACACVCARTFCSGREAREASNQLARRSRLLHLTDSQLSSLHLSFSPLSATTSVPGPALWGYSIPSLLLDRSHLGFLAPTAPSISSDSDLEVPNNSLALSDRVHSIEAARGMIG